MERIHTKNKWSINIFTPIPIRITPPINSTLFPKNLPTLFPIRTPRTEKPKATVPINIIGTKIETLKRAKLNPIANASMLVAMPNNIKTKNLRGLIFFILV